MVIILGNERIIDDNCTMLNQWKRPNLVQANACKNCWLDTSSLKFCLHIPKSCFWNVFQFTMRIIKRRHQESKIMVSALDPGSWAVCSQARRGIFVIVLCCWAKTCYSHMQRALHPLVLPKSFRGNMPISREPLDAISLNLGRKCYGK